MNLKFIIIWSFILLAGATGPLQKCDDNNHGTAGGADSGKTKTIGGVPKDNIKGVDTDPKPGNNGWVTAQHVGDGVVRVHWTPATDLETESSKLKYVVCASVWLVPDLSTLESDYRTGDYEEDINYKYVKLTVDEKWYIDVIVKDEADNIVRYLHSDVIDIDGNEAPVTWKNPDHATLGYFWALDSYGSHPHEIEVLFRSATDDSTPIEDLEYLIYYSLEDNINNLEDIERNGTPFGNFKTWTGIWVEDDQTYIYSDWITGLESNTKYYFNCIVRDSDGGLMYHGTSWNTTDVDDPPGPGGQGEMLTTVVSQVQINLEWGLGMDDYTDQADLEYLVYYSTANNISTVDMCLSNGTPFGSFVANIDTAEVTGLTGATVYYFNVVIKDGAGFMSAYNMINDTTEIDYPPIPGNSGVISSTFTGISQINLNWDFATDDVSPQADLQYLVYFSTTNNISTVDLCETNGTAVGSFVANSNASEVTSLTSATDYYFNVVVKDGIGNKAVYQMTGFTTLETDDPPVAGNTGVIEVGTVTSSRVSLSWTKATDSESLQTNLEYLVYYSTSDNLGTVTDCETNGTAFGSYTKDISAQTVAPLDPDTKYYFNLVVKDEGGNKICYQTTSATTDAAVFEIGSPWAGGIIIYLDGSGGGLVCALTDQSTSAEWGCYGTALTGCEGLSIGSGQANTDSIMSGCSTAGIAARVCDAYNDGTYSDWFLPSYYEGQEIANNLTAINNGLTANGGDTFSGNYWTSTQADYSQPIGGKGIMPDRRLSAWTIFSIGGPPYENKNTSLKVRAIRKF